MGETPPTRRDCDRITGAPPEGVPNEIGGPPSVDAVLEYAQRQGIVMVEGYSWRYLTPAEAKALIATCVVSEVRAGRVAAVAIPVRHRDRQPGDGKDDVPDAPRRDEL